MAPVLGPKNRLESSADRLRIGRKAGNLFLRDNSSGTKLNFPSMCLSRDRLHGLLQWLPCRPKATTNPKFMFRKFLPAENPEAKCYGTFADLRLRAGGTGPRQVTICVAAELKEAVAMIQASLYSREGPHVS